LDVNQAFTQRLEEPMTGDPFERAVGLARAALGAAPAGLVTDLDGTLSPIVDDPAAAQLVPGVPELLHELARRLTVVAVVSGRSAGDARRILGAAGGELLIVGNHGLEWLAPGSDAPEAPAAAKHLRASLEAALAAVPPLDGAFIDDKGLSATIHYRGVPNPAAARGALLAAVAELPRGIELREGRLSVELRPFGSGDKGTAVAAVAERYALRGLLVAGDDVTDLDMFRAADALRGRGVATLTLAVAGGREVPRRVSDATDATLPSPESFVNLLRIVAASFDA
jgi:trehalose 6-phosphate phosphatase